MVTFVINIILSIQNVSDSTFESSLSFGHILIGYLNCKAFYEY